MDSSPDGRAYTEIQFPIAVVLLAKGATSSHEPEVTWCWAASFLEYVLKERLAPVSRLASIQVDCLSLC